MPYRRMNSVRSVPSETALSRLWILIYLELLVTATLRVFQSFREWMGEEKVSSIKKLGELPTVKIYA